MIFPKGESLARFMKAASDLKVQQELTETLDVEDIVDGYESEVIKMIIQRYPGCREARIIKDNFSYAVSHAAFDGQLTTVKTLLKCRLEEAARIPPTEILGHACESDNVKLVRFTLALEGVDVNGQSSYYGNYPVLMACERGIFEIVKVLQDACANLLF